MGIYPIIKIRSDFPVLNKTINEYPLTYLDNAATTQKPKIVIDSQTHYYKHEYSSAHRSVHTLSVISTEKMESVRSYVAQFINASKVEEIIFVKSATEGINLIANSWASNFINDGENIIISSMEHHANILPWQILTKSKKIILHYIPLLTDGTLDLTALSKLVNYKTRLLAISHMSNVLGIVNPLKEIINIVRSKSNAIILIDGAQGIVHQKVDVQELDCDFYVFSGHKIYAPSGIGVVYGKHYLLNKMPPWIVGGGIVRNVSLNKEATFIDYPWKFETGSPNVAAILALGKAMQYVNSIGIKDIIIHEQRLVSYAIKKMCECIPNIIIYGPMNKINIIAFNFKKYHSYDVGTLLNQYGIAIRTGHHCAIPLMKHFQVSGMCRASFAMYSNQEDIDRLIQGLCQVQKFFTQKMC